MKKLAILLAFVIFIGGLTTQHATQAQDGGTTNPQDILDFRPLGRFSINANSLTISPNGLYATGTTSFNREIEADSTEDDNAPDTPPADGEDGDGDEEAEPIIVTVTELHMWDLRGGKHIWQEELPENRTLESIIFAPSSDILYVRTNRPYPAQEEVRLSFFATETGQLISQTGDIDVIQTPIIPGDLAQDLYIEPYFTPDGQSMIINY